MIISDNDLTKLVEQRKLTIDPFDPDCVQPSTYDLHLSRQFRVFHNHKLPHIDVKNKQVGRISELINVAPGGKFIIHPGEFVLGCTVEEIMLPDNLAAKLEGKSSLGRLGLIIHATAGYVDPGFKGWLTFEMSNIARVPIILYAGMKMAQICFFKMSSPVNRPYGTAGNKYQGQRGPTESRIWRDFN